MIAIDNDIVFKGACYDVLADIIAAVAEDEDVYVLGSAIYVVKDRILRTSLSRPSENAIARLLECLSVARTLEPSPSEISTAAALERKALEMQLPLHGGESILCAAAIERNLRLVVTGDKMAISALESLLAAGAALEPLCGRMRCLEQVMKDLLETRDPDQLRLSVCREPGVDKTLTICFGCTGPSSFTESIAAGLTSYIECLRGSAVHLLSG